MTDTNPKGDKMNPTIEPTICAKCKFFTPDNRCCTAPDAPYTDFVDGAKDPRDINALGDCSYFQHDEIAEPAICTRCKHFPSTPSYDNCLAPGAEISYYDGSKHRNNDHGRCRMFEKKEGE